MGYWGYSLYDNDLTNDIKDVFFESIKNLSSIETIYHDILDKFHEYLGDEEEPMLWYALADLQWQYGQIMPEVKNKALFWIEKTEKVSTVNDCSTTDIRWIKTLEKLKNQILSSPPSPRKITIDVPFSHNPWNVGDVYAFRFITKKSKECGIFGKYILFQKIANQVWCDGWILSRVQIFDRIFDELPISPDLSNLRILPFDTPYRFINKPHYDVLPLDMNGVLVSNTSQDYPTKQFTFICNQADPANMPISNVNTSIHVWRNMEKQWLCPYYQAWRGVEYIIEEGRVLCK